jgi:hypothetical protein
MEELLIPMKLYCDKKFIDLPVKENDLKELARRMRNVGLLTESELQNIEDTAEKMIKVIRGDK